jgi:hypothetical protein
MRENGSGWGVGRFLRVPAAVKAAYSHRKDVVRIFNISAGLSQ